jgi:hypothetical protein
MRKNLAGWDRGLRSFAAAVMLVAAFGAPVSAALRSLLAGGALYLVFSALAGTCFGYRLMGKSTCPVRS